MSLKAYIGGEGNILFELPDQAQMLELPHPILTNTDLAKLRETHLQQVRMPPTIPMLYPVDEGGARPESRHRRALSSGLTRRFERGQAWSCSATAARTRSMAPVPSLLATAAVHHHLMRNGTRMKIGIIVEAGDVREVTITRCCSDMAPVRSTRTWRSRSVAQMVREGTLPRADKNPEQAQRQVHQVGLNKGLLKVMSKMGISTLQSYQGAQIFEAIGLSPEVIDTYFTGTVFAHFRHRHRRASPKSAGIATSAATRRRREASAMLDIGGQYAYRATGRTALAGTPGRSPRCSSAVRMEDVKSYEEYSHADQRPDLDMAHHPARDVGSGARQRPTRPHRGGRTGHRDCEALRDRRDELRLASVGEAHENARHRHESHRRQEQYRRRRRSATSAISRTRTGTRDAARSSRSLPAVSASPPTTWSTPTSCRSRSRKAPSRAKAASCPVTRWTQSSPRLGTPRPA